MPFHLCHKDGKPDPNEQTSEPKNARHMREGIRRVKFPADHKGQVSQINRVGIGKEQTHQASKTDGAEIEKEHIRQIKLRECRDLCDDLRKEVDAQRMVDRNFRPGSKYHAEAREQQTRIAQFLQMTEKERDAMSVGTLRRYIALGNRLRCLNQSEVRFKDPPFTIRTSFSQVDWGRPTTRNQSPPTSPNGPFREPSGTSGELGFQKRA
ncbi:hypothetical protein BU16DRAFT_234015 [Lophium mytilinum]|uniref:Uncharacterized protein n=1 Tax=Lophium mytilinum TaxID=390894 RepID=A0A6A6R613_9PEZI|nr:hypothetical protein BU16DRAFT_234015 [Lophium mytilinum]